MRGILITSSILIVLIAALRPLLRGKIDPRAQYALWLLVAVRLLLPVNLFTSAYSALALLDRAEQPPQIVQTVGQTAIPVRSYDDARAEVIEDYRRQGGREADLTPADLSDIDAQARQLMRGPTLAQLAEKYAKAVWLAGAAIMAAWFIMVNLGLRRRLRGAKRLDGVTCLLPVYVSDALPSPCLCGTVRPRIYVTPAALESPERLRHVLAHELTHHRQKDHWWALVRCACLCLYWFDPLVWWAAALSRQDGELACDEGAIRALGEGERIPYGRTLVAMIAGGRTSLLQTATTMTGGKRRIKERVKLIARGPKTVIALALALVLIVAGAVGCTFSGAPEKGKTLENLQERLEDIPEELRPQVVNRPEDVSVLGQDGVLASYWWDVPADWENEFMPWLLAVYQWDEARLEEYLHPQGNGGYGAFDEVVVFARDSEHYYVFDQPSAPRFAMEGAQEYTAAYQAIRDFAEKAVLDTEGVEPYSPSTGTQTLDTLRARLEDIPAELRDDVVLYDGEPLWDSALASYFLDNTDGEGWLHTVCQWDQAEFEDWLYEPETGTYEVFARDREHYYAMMRPTSVQVGYEDRDRFSAAQAAIWEYARGQVLDTEGVEAYDPTELRQREYLWEGKTYTHVAYWPYKNITGDTEGSVWILSLVQLAEDGPGGVWIPEREQIIDADVDPTPQHVRPSEVREMGMTVTQYAQYLQEEADAGRADWATDPIQACMHYALTVCGHSEANVTEDCFTDDYRYIEGVLEGLLPTEEELAIQAVMDGIANAQGTSFELIASAEAGRSGASYTYQVDAPLDHYVTYWLTDFAKSFAWEKLTVLPDGAADGDTLIIQATDSLNCVWAYSRSNMIAIRTQDNQLDYYMAHDRGGSSNNAPLGTPRLNPGPYQILRDCFDNVELQQLRTTSVPDRGQSHEEVVREWIEGYEGAMTKCAPGSRYACTYARPGTVTADAHAHLTAEEMEEFAQYLGDGFAAEDYGKTWFSFGYSLVFVPENGDTNGPFWARNTDYYQGDDAPEGALTWGRVAYMRLADGNWVCEGTGTGW